MYTQDVYTNGSINYPKLLNNTLLTYNIFVPVSIHNVYISKIIFKMIKKHLYATKPLAQTAGSQTVSVVDLKFPVEFIYFGVKLVPQVTDIDWNMEYWHRFVGYQFIDNAQ